MERKPVSPLLLLDCRYCGVDRVRSRFRGTYKVLYCDGLLVIRCRRCGMPFYFNVIPDLERRKGGRHADFVVKDVVL